jgi:hypothetical protein
VGVKIGLHTEGGKHKLKVFQAWVLRKPLRSKGKGVGENWRKQHRGELHGL